MIEVLHAIPPITTFEPRTEIMADDQPQPQATCCRKCKCADILRSGRYKICRACGARVLNAIYRGPRCRYCDGEMEVTHTSSWIDGKRDRRYRCLDCGIPRVLTETDLSVDE